MHRAGWGCAFVFASWLLPVPPLLTGCVESPVISGEDLDAQGGGLDLAIHGGAFARFDVLLVIDDSLSMHDKRSILAEGLAPILFEPQPSGHEPEGFAEAFRSPLPVGTHIGVISTSLSSGGITQCRDRDGRARLRELPGEDSEFLVTTVGEDEADGQRLRALLDSVEDSGCGYEAPLEAAYRFLIDPEPPAHTTVEERDGVFATVSTGIDTTLLRQREAFLRPESALAVLLLTDEDDCSVMDFGQGFRAGLDNDMPRASSSCLTAPSSPCCRSCDDLAPPPSGCGELEEDPACQLGPLGEEENHTNLRCFDVKRRFGVDFLFPIERYVEGFSQLQIKNRNGELIENPLFSGGRDPRRVFFGAIVGVPWQAIASEASVELGEQLRFLSPQELAESKRWPGLVGPAADPHLIPSIEPRDGLADPGSTPWTDPWNSHEYDNPFSGDLQYSCVFPLEEPRTCEDDDPGCDCARRTRGEDLAPDSPNNPLCQDSDETYGQVQYLAKAYPPPRILEFMRQLGDQAQIGSVCPKTLEADRSGESAYGYRAALRQAVIEPLRGLSPDSCFPLFDNRYLDDRRCRMFEVHEDSSEDCDLPGRAQVSSSLEAAIRKRHEDRTDGRYLCEVLAAPGDVDDVTSFAHACENDAQLSEQWAGYCIIRNGNDAASQLGDSCTDGQRLRVHPPDLLRTLSNGETLLLQVCSIE